MIEWISSHQILAVEVGAIIGAAAAKILDALVWWISDMEPIYRYRRWRNRRKDARS